MRRLRTSQARHHRARGLAAGHHQAAHAARHQRFGDTGERLLHQRTGGIAPQPRLQRRHAFGRGGGGNHHRHRSQALRRPLRRLMRQRIGIGRGQRIEFQHRHDARAPGRSASAWRASRSRRSPRRVLAHRAARPDRSRCGSDPARRKFSGRPMATPDPPVTSAYGAAASPIARRWASVSASTIAQCRPCSFSAVMARRMAGAPCSTVANGTSPTGRARLPPEHAHEVGVAHRCQRMVFHAAFDAAARCRRRDGPDRRCGRWWGRPGRRARSRCPAHPSALRRPGRYCRRRCCRRSSSI